MNKEFIENFFGKQIRIRVCGILKKNHKILFLKHLNLGEDYLWAPPGGGLNYGETIEECLTREFKEETGLNIKVHKFITFHEFIQLPLHALELFFEVSSDDKDFILGSDPELNPENQILNEIQFLSLEDLQKEKNSNLHALSLMFFK